MVLEAIGALLEVVAGVFWLAGEMVVAWWRRRRRRREAEEG
jgi:hypothetical protein